MGTVRSAKNKPLTHSLEAVTGSATYSVDIELPNMLYAKCLRSPYAHAVIKNIDVRKALAHPDVKAVLTHMDVPRVLFNSGDKIPFVPEMFVKDEYVLDEHVRFVGDEVAAVAATSLDSAEEALGLIDVQYEQLPAIFDAEESMKKGAALIHGEILDTNVVKHEAVDIGDVNQGFGKADYVFEDRYRLQIVDHCCMEPHCAVADYDASGKLTLWSSTQNSFMVRGQMARLFNLPLTQVRIIQSYVGGAFGSKQGMTVEPICVSLSMKTRRPVKMELTREEMFIGTTTRHSAVIDIKSGLSKDGLFTARQMKAVFNTGAYCSAGPSVTSLAGWSFVFAYNSPNTLFDGYTVYTNLPAAGAYRGYGTPQSNFAVESQVDRICDELGFDEIEFRLKNSPKVGDLDPLTGYPVSSSEHEQCLRRGAKEIGWTARKKPAEKSGRLRRGIGMSSTKYITGVGPFLPDFATIRIACSEDGTVFVHHGVAELGEGCHTVIATVVSEELQVPYEQIIVNPYVDTDLSPWDRGTHGSRATLMAGNAAILAARKVKHELLVLAAEMLDAVPEDLQIDGGKIIVKGSTKSVTVSDVVCEAKFKKNHPICVESTYNSTVGPITFGANFAEVEVNMDTGEVRVVRTMSVHDVGKVVSQLGSEGQVEGGVVMALGYALTEETLYDQETGRVLNPTFRDYKMLGLGDLPKIDYVFIEQPDPGNELGSKSLSESCMNSIIPAISNAIYNATGIRLKETPFTADKIIEANRKEA